jgi:two-component system, cell cycle sensor histidine kinase DivJ
VADAVRIEGDARIDCLVRDAGDELATLRRDVARYRNVFDSARLIVGHEFSRPLTAISGYLDLVEEKLGTSVGDEERRYFGKIRESIGRLDDLIDSFVQMLRFEKGTDEAFALERVEIKSLLETVKGRFAEHEGSIVAEIEGEIPVVLARRRCLEVAVENLVSNAVKHGGASGRVGITACLKKDRRGSSNEELLVVSVEDHGAGIPADKIEEIFRPFTRLGGVSDASGLGLGLTLVKSIVTIVRGEIYVQSRPGEGTTVTIAVPVQQARNETADTIG